LGGVHRRPDAPKEEYMASERLHLIIERAMGALLLTFDLPAVLVQINLSRFLQRPPGGRTR